MIATGGVVLLIALGTALHAPVDRQLHAWKLLPEPEKLTELYFTSPNTLPSTYTPGQTQTVSFTTHNLEYQTTDYSYRITESAPDGSRAQTVATGAFSLPQNAYKRQNVIIPTADIGQNVKVEVELMNVHESIDYLLERRGA
jgi:hypothetical protein